MREPALGRTRVLLYLVPLRLGEQNNNFAAICLIQEMKRSRTHNFLEYMASYEKLRQRCYLAVTPGQAVCPRQKCIPRRHYSFFLTELKPRDELPLGDIIASRSLSQLVNVKR
jgi:hypothetical protein